MIRTEVVRRLVLNSICDDFENVDQVILRDVAEAATRYGLTVERADVVDALAGLVEDGLAKAYILRGSGRDPFSGVLQGMPVIDTVEEDFQTYFFITKKGMDLHLADDTWRPLDEEGKPR
jgi:hypothetical protein